MTTGTDSYVGTAKNDLFTGVVSSLSSEKTLTSADIIDGAAGIDTLQVSMKGNFAGFTGDGKMENVEIVNLTNESTVARTFTADGVTDVTPYNLEGAVNLASLDSIVTVNAGARTSDLSITYANTVTDGTADTLALGLTDNGTADDASTTANEEAAVTVTVDGIEQTDLTVAGTNVVNLNGLASKDLTATGTGSIKIKDLDVATKTLDASGMTGNVDVTLGAATAATLVSTGSGDDKVTVNISDDLTANATVAGGAGDDTLVLTSIGARTVQYTQSGFETIELGAGAKTISLKNTEDLANIIVNKAANAANTLASAGAIDLAIDVQGVNANSVILTSDHTGASTVTVSTPDSAATVAAPSANDTDLKLTGTSSVDLTVDTKMSYAGTITAEKATSVVAALNGAATAGSVISAAKATSVVISAVDADSDLDIIAAAALDVNITNAKALTLIGATDLTAAESFVSSGAGALTMTGKNLSAANIVNISNTGAVDVGNIGSGTLAYSTSLTATGNASLEVKKIATNNQNITVNATDIVGNVTIGDTTDAVNAGTTGNTSITLGAGGNGSLAGTVSGKNVTIDAGEVLGTMAYTGDITAQNFTFVAAQLTNNDLSGTGGAGNVVLTGTTNTISLTGGIEDDKFLFENAITTTTVVATGDLNVGADTVAFDFSKAVQGQAYSLDISGLSDYDTSNITLSAAQEATVKLGSGTDVDTIQWSGAKKATITGFDTTEDKLSFDGVATGIETSGTAKAAGAAGIASLETGKVYVFADGATAAATLSDTTTPGSKKITDYTSKDQVAEYLAEAFTATAKGDVAVFVINDLVGKKSYAYSFSETADAASTISADELTIIGVITEESGDALVAGDIA